MRISQLSERRPINLNEKADIHSADQLRALGADAAYQKLLASGTRPHFIGYYALVMGLQGRPWNDLDAIEKTALRERFDHLVTETRWNGLSGIEGELDRLGVVARN